MKMLTSIWSLVFIAVALGVASMPTAQGAILVPRQSTWKYENSGTDLGTNWIQSSFDDTTWSGPAIAPLGDNVDTAVQSAATVIAIGNAAGKFPVVYFRKAFTASSISSYQNLILRIKRDDFAVVFLNGIKILNDGVPEPLGYSFSGGTGAGGADETRFWEYSLPTTALQEGNNVIAVAVYQQASASSDLLFDLELEGYVDNVPPLVAEVRPATNTSVLTLNNVTVSFDSEVLGVDASDLLVNSVPATNLTVLNPREFIFYFQQPETGTVQIAWAAEHGITDVSILSNPFPGTTWTYNLDTNTALNTELVISEFMADNENGIRDEDGIRSDWIELRNTGSIHIGLQGWFLTDNATNLTKWRFPDNMPTLGANNYLLVWASAKDKTNALAPLHTNFKLGKDGGFLALVDPTTNVISVFSNYPPQSANVSYGRDRVDPSLTGYFTNATPRLQNATTGSGFAPEPVFSFDTGIYTNASLSLVITAPMGTIRYTTDGTLPTTNSTLYTAPILVNVNRTIKARAFPPAGTNLFPSTVVGKNYIFLDNTTIDFSSNLPIMIVSTEGRGIVSEVAPGGNRTKGSFTIINVQGARSTLRTKPDLQVQADFEFFGQTSIGFAKKPIRVETQDALNNDLDVSILGMPADSDYKIRNPYNDKSMLNDFLAGEYFEEMGNYALRRRFVEAFVDSPGARLSYSDYYGIMVILENIKIGKDRVDIEKVPNTATTEPAIAGGYIFKKDKVSTGDLDFSTTGGSTAGGNFAAQGLKFHEPKPNDLRINPVSGPLTAAGNAQSNYLRGYLIRMEQAMYSPNWLTLTGTNHYSNYLDMDSFVDFHWLVEFTKQIDGYRISSYFHKDRGGKVKAGPIWDWNLAFGNANYLLGGQTNGWYYDQLGDGDHIWLRRLITGSTAGTASAGDPEFTQKIADRWAVLRTNLFNGTNVINRIDQLAGYLNEAATRDLAKYNTLGIYTWPNPDMGVITAGSLGTADGRDVDFVRPRIYNDNTTNSIIYQMKRYMFGRYLSIDSQFVEPPTFSASSGEVTNGFSVTITPPAGASVFYTLDGSDPRLPGGNVSPAAVSNNGPVTITINANVRIVARATRPGSWKSTWSGPSAISLFSQIPSLRITEVMYHPAPPPPGSTNSANDFEYIEVQNIGASPLSLAGFSIAGGIQFQFPSDVTLNAGQTAVIVANVSAFNSRYGPGALILGTFTGSLNNAGDRLALSGPLQEAIVDFTYDDLWHPATDGAGFSLVVNNENAPTSSWTSADGWRPSATAGGSPGAVDPSPPTRPVVLVNEVLTKLDQPVGDVIELYNPNPTAVNLGGWFLTDNYDQPMKFTIQANTMIPAGGYLVFRDTNSFAVNGTNSFGLSSFGEQVYLFSGDGFNLTGYAHGFSFGASERDITIGSYTNSLGERHIVALASNTLGSANSSPLVGPIVISEINYHPLDLGHSGLTPSDTEAEYIELQNISGAPVPLYDVTFPTNRWRLRNAVDFDFNTNLVIQPGGYVLVVGFDPEANPGALARFRAKNGVDSGVPVVGPWTGSLNNAGETIELRKPGIPDTNGTPSILVEQVAYSPLAPWPASADGFGLSLQRINPATYGNDPVNWAASSTTPSANYAGGAAPIILTQPGDRVLIFSNDFFLAASASGAAPLRYQWRFNGGNILNATNSVLSLTNFQQINVGTYNVLVYNPGGYVFGTNFYVSGRVGLRATSQPASRLAQTNTSTTFAVTAVGSGPVRYQWRFNGSDIPNETNASYTISSIQPAHDGTYVCVLTDDFNTIATDPAVLTVVYRTVINVQPVAVVVTEGSTAVFSVAGGGTYPLGFRWRTNLITFSNAIISSTISNSFIYITNVSKTFSNYNISVVITNVVTATGVPASTTSVAARLTVLPDRDRDGLPDQWEIDRGMNPDDPAEGAADADGDGMSNAAEFVAGTDYLIPGSSLQAQMFRTNGPVVQFQAISNRTYSVLYRNALGAGPWEKLADVVARTNNHTEVFPDPGFGTNRFYRLTIPAQRY